MAGPSAFIDPPWEAPLDAERVIAQVPETAAIAGMFFLALAAGAERRRVKLELPRARYLPFGFYPVKEFAPLLVTAAGSFYPDKSLREGLRRIGTAAPVAFLGSTLGRVTLGASEGPHAMVSAIAKTYAINTRPSRCDVLEASPRSMLIRLEEVWYFLDSHHVGVFEGTLHFAGVQGRVQIRSHSATSADLRLDW